MAITVNGQILRNLPEQVSKNTEDIIELQEQSNNYGIRITALEGDAIALATFQDCTFTGTTTFTGPLNSSDGFTFGNDGYVAGDLSVGGALSVTGSSTFTGNVNASGNITAVGAITAASQTLSGNLQVGGTIKAMEKIVDAQGRPRFIEWDLTPRAITGFTATYAKASLSGTHLMIVLAGTLANGTELTDGQTLASINNLPVWITNKIYPVWGGVWVERKAVEARAEDWTQQTLTTGLSVSSGYLAINKGGAMTLTADRAFRVQYDLLIDSL